jgi:hypothetical protein
MTDFEEGDDPTKPLRFDQLTPQRQSGIQANIAKMHAAGAPESEIEEYLTQHEHLAPVTAEPTHPVTAHGSTGSWGGADASDTSALGNVGRAALNGATLGAGNKIIAGGNAALDALHGQPFHEAYQQRLASEREASKQFADRHPIGNLATEAVGGLGSMIASGGMSAPQELANVGRLARIGKAAATGLDLGAVSGAVNADGDMGDRAMGAMKGAAIGGIGGAVLTPLVEAGGYLANKAHIPDAVSALSQRAAKLFPDASSAQRALQTLSRTTGAKGQAADEIAQRVQMDRAAGPSETIPAAVPQMTMDQSGPNLEGLAKGIVRRPGAGGGVIRNALQERGAQMRPSVTSAFDQATGTTEQDGEALLARLADEHGKLESAQGVVAEAKRQAGRSAPDVTTTPNALATWRDEMGGSLTNGIKALRQYVGDRTTEARQLYGAARQATNGQPMQSDALDQILETPVGKDAFKWATIQKANRNAPLASVPGAEVVPGELSTAEWATVQERARQRGMPVPSMGTGPAETAPDPETLHFMKQRLAKLARLGVNDGQGGTIATQAEGALRQWGAIREQMPPEWQAADEAFSKRSRVIDALNVGRNLIRTNLNPSGQKALSTSLDAIEQQMANASPEEQHAFRVGGQSAVTDFLRSGGSGKSLAAQLQEPSSVMSRRIVLATGDPDAPARLAQKLAPTTTTGAVQQAMAPPPIPQLSSGSQAAGRGLDVFRTPVAPSSAAPEKSLGILRSLFGEMAAPERQAVQQGAAQAGRGEWLGASGNVKSPGRVFDFNSPEKAEQLGYAFPHPDIADQFKNHVQGWDNVIARGQRITGGSDTQANLAEQAARDRTMPSAIGQLMHGRLGGAVRALGGGLSTEATSAARQKLDEEIARILTSRGNALNTATGDAQLRQRLGAILSKALGAAPIVYSNNP